jgi:hypothetical protein
MERIDGRTYAITARTKGKAHRKESCGRIGEISGLTRAIFVRIDMTSARVGVTGARTFAIFATIDVVIKSAPGGGFP